MSSLTAHILSDFNIERTVSEGQTTIIYTAVEKSTGKKYIIKECRNAAMTAEVIKLFNKEIARLTALSHINIPVIISSFTKKPHGYILMQHTTGVDLAALKNKNEEEKLTPIPCLTTAQLKSVSVQLINVLDYLHSKQIPHYDLKPSNILYCIDGTIKLLDFGSAKSVVTHSSAVAISHDPGYLSPEVLSNRISTARDPKSFLRADIWSLGAVLLDLAIGAYTYDVNAEDSWNALEKLRNDAHWTLLEALESYFVDKAENKRMWRSRDIVDVREIIEMCLISNPLDRKSIGDIILSSSFQRLRSEIFESAPPPEASTSAPLLLDVTTADFSVYDCAQVLSALKGHGKSASVVIKSLDRLYELCCRRSVSINPEVNISMFYSHSGWITILPLLSRYETNHEISAKSFVLLMALAQNSKIKSKLGEFGCCEAVVSSLKASFRNETVAKNGCGLLMALALNDKNCVKLGACGGCELVVTILSSHKYNQVIAEYGCGAVLALALNNANRLKLGSHGACEVLTSTLSAYASNKKIVEYGLGAFLSMTKNIENIQKLVSRGAGNAVMTVLRSISDESIICIQGLALVGVFARHSKDTCHKLGLLGFCETVVYLLKLHMSDPAVAAQGCFAVRYLATIPENSTMLGTHAAFETVFTALRVHLRDLNVVTDGFCAISNLSTTETNKVKFGKVGGCEAIISIMTTHLKVARVAEAGCIAIANLAYDNKENQMSFGLHGACEIVFAVLTSHMADESVATNACLAMAHISKYDGNSPKLRSCGAFESLLAALKLHTKSSRVVEVGCTVLRVLACDEENRFKLGMLGACEAVVVILMAHSNSANVVLEGCWAICNLAEDSQNSVRFGTCWGCEALVSAFVAHADNAVVAEASCKGIRNLSRENAANKSKLGDCGACEILASVLKLHVNVTAVVEQCLMAIQNLAADDENCSKFGECGVCESILPSIQTHLDVPQLVEHGCTAIYNLSVNDHNSALLEAAGACGVLTSVKSLYTKKKITKVSESATKANKQIMWNYKQADGTDSGEDN